MSRVQYHNPGHKVIRVVLTKITRILFKVRFLSLGSNNSCIHFLSKVYMQIVDVHRQKLLEKLDTSSSTLRPSFYRRAAGTEERFQARSGASKPTETSLSTFCSEPSRRTGLKAAFPPAPRGRSRRPSRPRAFP